MSKHQGARAKKNKGERKVKKRRRKDKNREEEKTWRTESTEDRYELRHRGQTILERE